MADPRGLVPSRFGTPARMQQSLKIIARRSENYLSLVNADHLETLRERTFSNADRLERDYRAYLAKHGHISKDEYLETRLSGGNDQAEVSVRPTMFARKPQEA